MKQEYTETENRREISPRSITVFIGVTIEDKENGKRRKAAVEGK